MPKNAKKKKNSKNTKGNPLETRTILLKDEGQEYARVIKKLGGPMLSVKCCDGTDRIAKIRGKMMKRCWMSAGDWILVTLREFDDKKVDVVHKYNDDEVRHLQKSGEIFEIKSTGLSTAVEETEHSDEEDAFVFEDL